MNDVSIHIFQHDDIGFVTAMDVPGGVHRPSWDKGITLGVGDSIRTHHVCGPALFCTEQSFCS